MGSNLATRLRVDTRQSHTIAENTAFMKCFLKGVVELVPFRHLLANLYLVYTALEQSLEKHRHTPILSSIYFPELNRKDNLERDLAFYYGDNWRDQITPLRAGLVYVNRIYEIAESDPLCLIAHAYTRYMGDLSGGQALKSIVRSAFDLPEGIGVALYEFEQIPTIEAKRNFKAKYRQTLDDLSLDEEAIARIITEANYAFLLNRNVVNELEIHLRAAIGDHVFELLTKQDRLGSTESAMQDMPHDAMLSA
ncbi:MAG: heme oxygenase (biliverdin-producing) [Pseudanabaenaceae cyanobacterium bins.39]|nr:heme oxygenase (biliverdin-producing) [Pseudanabaenaceae cyanobacterium bins.39]